ncbi:MAG: DMT family transporter, partial [Desulfatiglandales bacterium]
LVASICLFLWMKWKKEEIFPQINLFLHGMVVGLLFGGEFAFIYVALRHTTASSTYILLYTAPFFASIGAHLWLQNDRLSLNKAIGLVLAFLGVAILFSKGASSVSGLNLKGDLLALCAGILWGMTSVYVKKFLAGKANATHVLFYQLFFSAPFLFLMSLILESNLIIGFSKLTFYSLVYQSIIVAFLSYLSWFKLIDQYPVSLLHAFSFFTPVFGVIISGILMLKEPIGLPTLSALFMVSIGTFVSNMKRG